MEISRYWKIFGVGPIGYALSLGVFILLWILDWALGSAAICGRSAPVRISGLILIVLWGCWHSWSVSIIGNWWRHDSLCTTGPYRFVRHPMYAGVIWLGSPGIGLMWNSWIMLVCPLILYPIWSVLVRREERMMAEVFGDEYRRYAARTGRLFPRA